MDFKMDNVELLLSVQASEEAASATARSNKKGGAMQSRAPRIIVVSEWMKTSSEFAWHVYKNIYFMH